MTYLIIICFIAIAFPIGLLMWSLAKAAKDADRRSGYFDDE